MKDVFEMFRVVLDERKKREIDPTAAVLRACVAEAARDKETDEYTEQKLRELADFFDTASKCYTQIRDLPVPAVARLLKTGGKLRKLLGL
jgi:DNA-binding transcriptional regulator GbsR (MarR family)